MPFQLKDISQDNIEAAWELFNALCDEQGSRKYLVSSFESFSANFSNTDGHRFEGIVGYDGDEPVALVTWGYLFSLYNPRPALYMRTLYVKPDYRGRGFGSELVSVMARKAHDEDCCAMKWAVMPDNRKALDFYKSMGIGPDDDGLIEFWVGRDDFKKLSGCFPLS